MKKKLFLLILPILLTSLMLTGCKKNQEETPDVSSSSLSDEGSPVTPLAPDASLVALNTDKGQILIELFPSLAPNTVKNFLEKANSGFYSGLTFHRVESWVVQGGDPEGTGAGGATQSTELSQEPFRLGSVGIARGQDINISNDSQFFICTEDCSWLTGQYTLLGEVVSGLDIAQKIQIGDKILSISASTK